MAENKTKPTDVSPAKYVSNLPTEEARRDSRALMKIMAELTRKRPKMWGTSIIGYGSYHYKYESGREGDMPIIGFAPRARELVMYLMPGFGDLKKELAQLGKHRKGKSCLCLKDLSGVDMAVLKDIMSKSVSEMQRMYSAK